MINEYIPLILGVIAVAFLGSVLWQMLELLQGILHYLETINNSIKDSTSKSSDQKINQQMEKNK